MMINDDITWEEFVELGQELSFSPMPPWEEIRDFDPQAFADHFERFLPFVDRQVFEKIERVVRYTAGCHKFE